jgi:hypothetical protein
VRGICFFHDGEHPLYLIAIYAKVPQRIFR